MAKDESKFDTLPDARASPARRGDDRRWGMLPSLRRGDSMSIDQPRFVGGGAKKLLYTVDPIRRSGVGKAAKNR